ncbi:MAG TPA: ArdC family protein [Roseiflexaceae bacterium]|nr:ArdC family protein [Roseiflexaceae bacterium]
MARRGQHTSPEERAAAARERLGQLGDQLTAAVASIQGSDEFIAYLRTQARFHSYSFRNTLLIMMQRPDATQVAGYQTWQALGRQVRKGETGIRIYAPMTFRAKEGQEGGDSATRVGFRSVAVFDVSQTDGEPLPDISPAALIGEDGDELYTALAAVTQAQGVQLTYDCPPGCDEADGAYLRRSRTIYIKPQARLQMTLALAHELAHANDDQLAESSKAERETVAEGVAFMTLAAFGLETGAHSFRYIAGWNGDQDGRATLMQCMQRIQRIAGVLIDQATAHLDPEASAQQPESETAAELEQARAA